MTRTMLAILPLLAAACGANPGGGDGGTDDFAMNGPADLAGDLAPPAPATTAGPGTTSRYASLASTLADDELWADPAQKECKVYLAVEAIEIGTPFNDCGGRTPLMDVVDASLTLLTVGRAGVHGDGT